MDRLTHALKFAVICYISTVFYIFFLCNAVLPLLYLPHVLHKIIIGKYRASVVSACITAPIVWFLVILFVYFLSVNIDFLGKIIFMLLFSPYAMVGLIVAAWQVLRRGFLRDARAEFRELLKQFEIEEAPETPAKKSKKSANTRINMNIFSPYGRLDRKTFISTILSVWLILVIYFAIMGVITVGIYGSTVFDDINDFYEDFLRNSSYEMVHPLWNIGFILCKYLHICALAKRFRDIKWNPWCSLFGIFDFVGIILIILCFFKKSKYKKKIKHNINDSVSNIEC